MAMDERSITVVRIPYTTEMLLMKYKKLLNFVSSLIQSFRVGEISRKVQILKFKQSILLLIVINEYLILTCILN